MATQTKFNQNEPKGDIMVMTSPYHTASITAYPEIEESRSDLLISEEVANAQLQEDRLTATGNPAEVWAVSRKEAILARIARGFLAFYDRLSGPGMTERDRVYRDISEAMSGWNGRLEQQKLP